MRNDGLSNADFQRLRSLVYSESGINLGADRRVMLEIRIRRRLRKLDIASFAEYCDFVFGREGKQRELTHLIDAVTTNKTDFFREAGHFDFLASKALPELTQRHGLHHPLLAWSAGCSTGEEPYTLGMVLNEYALTHPGFQFRILATDICTEVLKKASLAIFKSDLVAPVPHELRRKYFLRSRDSGSDLLRIVPELRERVEFRQLNFMDDDFGIRETPDIIFCRNVIIYFDRATQQRIVRKLFRHLAPGGYFFAGHSESLQGMDLPLTAADLAVYRKVP